MVSESITGKNQGEATLGGVEGFPEPLRIVVNPELHGSTPLLIDTVYKKYLGNI